MKRRSFENQVVVVTGASSGIGRETAVRFAREGAKTVLVARSRENLGRVAEEIRTSGGDALIVAADVSLSSSVVEAVRTIDEEHGRVDILFNNAGKSFVGRTDEADFEEKTRDMFEVDYLGTVRMTQAVLPILKRQGGGHILNMSSVVGRKAFPGFGGYSSVMHALDGYTGALRQELKGSGIEVSTIHPALTQTPLLTVVSPEDMPPPFRYLSPISVERVAAAVVEGIRRNHPRIVVPWQPRLLMLAEAISPRLGDRLVEWLQNPLLGRLAGTYRGETYRAEAVSGNAAP